MNLSWGGLFVLGYELEVEEPTKRGQWQQIQDFGTLWVVRRFGWRIRLAKGQVRLKK